MPPIVHLIGLPTDQNSSFERGAALAPAAIRAALWSDRGNLSAQSGLEIGTDVTLLDLGDLPLSDVNCATDDMLIMQAVVQTLDSGAIPLLLGGDHAVTYPVVAALARRYGPLNILHFDAHPDLYEYFEGKADYYGFEIESDAKFGRADHGYEPP